jgi:hypothetical protein
MELPKELSWPFGAPAVDGTRTGTVTRHTQRTKQLFCKEATVSKAILLPYARATWTKEIPRTLQGLGEGNQPLLDRKIGVWRRGHGVRSRWTRMIRIQKKRRKERARGCDIWRTSLFWCLLEGEGAKMVTDDDVS